MSFNVKLNLLEQTKKQQRFAYFEKEQVVNTLSMEVLMAQDAE